MRDGYRSTGRQNNNRSDSLYKLENKYLTSVECKPAIVGVPYEEGAYWRKGMKEGPDAIIMHLMKMHTYSVRTGKIMNWKWEDLLKGKLDLCPYNKESCLKKIEDRVSEILKDGSMPFLLGGDHSISLPAIRALSKFWGEDEIGILHFDSHSDTFAPVEGYEYHHGATFRNVVKENLVLPQNIFQFGLRGQVRTDSFRFAIQNRINQITMREFRAKGCSLETFDIPKDKYYYLSFDIDVVDPAFAPGTGTPVPGGLTSNEVLDLIEQLSDFRLIGVDLVEVVPVYDYSNITSLLAANIVFEILVCGQFVSLKILDEVNAI